jgi:hypothetical protein
MPRPRRSPALCPKSQVYARFHEDLPSKVRFAKNNRWMDEIIA